MKAPLACLPFNRFILFSTITGSIITSTAANAEISFLEDEQLSELSGQAGLTIDFARVDSLVEFEYVDAGFISTPGISIEGHGHQSANPYYTNQLDNLRVNISLSEQSTSQLNEAVDYGFSEFRSIAELYLANGNKTSTEAFEQLAQGYDPLRDNLKVDGKRRYNEGDLVIHLNYLDAFEKDGGYEAYSTGDGLSGNSFVDGSIEEANRLVSSAMDFKYDINEVDMAFGNNLLGVSAALSSTDSRSLSSSSDGSSGGTRLMSNLSVQGYLGPHDLHLEEINYGNDGAANEDERVGITWDSYFKVTDLDVYLDIAGIQISDVRIHNHRGDQSGINMETQDGSVGNSSFGFAHATREIHALEDEYWIPDDPREKKKKRKGISFNTRFKGDIDIGHISFGDTATSLGSYYFTDFYFNRRMKISPRD